MNWPAKEVYLLIQGKLRSGQRRRKELRDCATEIKDVFRRGMGSATCSRLRALTRKRVKDGFSSVVCP